MSDPLNPVLRLHEILRSARPVDDILHVVTVVSNFMEYQSRWRLARQFIAEMEQNPEIRLYVVELAYNDQSYRVTEADNPRHLQLRTKIPLWHKESMINVAVRKLLPANWKAFSWIDCDLTFENVHWASETLAALSEFDILQPWSHCLDLDPEEIPMHISSSAGSQRFHNVKFPFEFVADAALKPRYYHCGYAWAMTRATYEKLGGLFEAGIVGGGDNVLLQAVLGHENLITRPVFGIEKSKMAKVPSVFTKFLDDCRELKFGYTPGVIRHHYHGTKQNRRKRERTEILRKWNFDPEIHLAHDEAGLMIPSAEFPEGMARDVAEYFALRKEDE